MCDAVYWSGLIDLYTIIFNNFSFFSILTSSFPWRPVLCMNMCMSYFSLWRGISSTFQLSLGTGRSLPSGSLWHAPRASDLEIQAKGGGGGQVSTHRKTKSN